MPESKYMIPCESEEPSTTWMKNFRRRAVYSRYYAVTTASRLHREMELARGLRSSPLYAVAAHPRQCSCWRVAR